MFFTFTNLFDIVAKPLLRLHFGNIQSLETIIRQGIGE